MPIVSTDIVYRLSGGATNVSPLNSRGGAMSTDVNGVITPGAANNLWDDVSGAESSAGDIEYRCFYVTNIHATLVLQTAVIWIDALTTSTSTEFDIGLDPAAVGADTAIAITATEETAPAGITFTRPTTKGTGLAIGNMPAGSAASKKAIWIRRTVTAAAAAASDSGSIRVEGDTAP